MFRNLLKTTFLLRMNTDINHTALNNSVTQSNSGKLAWRAAAAVAAEEEEMERALGYNWLHFPINFTSLSDTSFFPPPFFLRRNKLDDTKMGVKKNPKQISAPNVLLRVLKRTNNPVDLKSRRRMPK